MNRRSFLKSANAAGLTLALPVTTFAAEEKIDNLGQLFLTIWVDLQEASSPPSLLAPRFFLFREAGNWNQ